MSLKLIPDIFAVRIVVGFEFSAATDAFSKEQNSPLREEDSKITFTHGQFLGMRHNAA